MREIKFRAWDINNKKMYPSYIVDENGAFCVNGDFTNNCEVSEEDKVIPMQFTGLKDKNGKEIYEGDIMYVSGVGNVEIIFSDGCFGYVWEGCFCAFYEDQEGDIERIIGNIWENPALLEGEKQK